MPFIFTGLQISIGVAWFSLVAGEMVSGKFGLGYVINTSYTMVRYPTIIIGMITLGVVGYVTSAMVRMVGDYMMQWRVRELALGGSVMQLPRNGSAVASRAQTASSGSDPHRGRRQDLRSRRRRRHGGRSLLARHPGRRDLHDRAAPPAAARRPCSTRSPAFTASPRAASTSTTSCCAGPRSRRPSPARTASSCSRTARCFRGRRTSRTSPSAR